MEDLTGSPAESFETTARRYAAMPFAQQNLANRLKAFLAFNITPFYPGYDVEAYERRLELPNTGTALHCMEDERWKASHAEQMAVQGIASAPAPVSKPDPAGAFSAASTALGA